MKRENYVNNLARYSSLLMNLSRDLTGMIFGQKTIKNGFMEKMS